MTQKIPTALLEDASVTTDKLGFNQGGQLAGLRNKIINGKMEIDQRNAGAAFNSAGEFYGLDRWVLQAVGAINTGQQVAGSKGSNKAFRVTGSAGNTVTVVYQKIESWNSMDLAGRIVTVSFTLHGSNSGSVDIRHLYPTATDNYAASTEPVAGIAVAFTTTPTRYSVTFTANANATKGMLLAFSFGGVGASVTRTLEDVQLEVGSVATPFEHRPYGMELALCQRYYSVQNPTSGFALAITTTSARVGIQPFVPMRATPTLSRVGNLMRLVGNGVDTTQSAASFTDASSFPNMTITQLGNFTGLTAGLVYVFGDSAAQVGMFAEL